VPPAVGREFRAIWVATVGNIDWPSKPGLSTWDQQRELLAILDKAAELKMNAVIFQVRPGADALYDSPYEPWSESDSPPGTSAGAAVGPAPTRWSVVVRCARSSTS
jgi:uncharacterized lipoprotein YddW (UPF0748 family)